MIDRLMRWLRNLWRSWTWTPEDHFKDFCRHKAVQVNAGHGFAINGLAIDEFHYLLGVVSGGQCRDFSSFRAIYDCRQHILFGLVQELRSPRLAEEALVSHETALENMRNLQGIVRTIVELVERADQLGVPLPR